ncbi:MAG: hypothetical protein ACFFED_01380 [Candidatus Thorarchaeota archaeon]
MRCIDNKQFSFLPLGVRLTISSDKKKTAGKRSKKRYLFKVTVVGPDDKLLEKVLSIVNDNAVAVDGIRIGTAAIETEESNVRAVTWSPRHSALEMLLSVTFAGANAVVIVMPDADPEIEAIYRNEIREHLGSGVPTRVLIIDSEIDKFKRLEIVTTFDELYNEILLLKNKSESE